MKIRRLTSAVALPAWLLCMGPFATACHKKDEPAPAAPVRREKPAFPVEVAPVGTGKVEYNITATGSLEAFETVAITAKVPGVVEHIGFTEGDTVKPGQELVAIELERYVLAVRAAEATLERAKATQAEAEGGVARRERAVSQTPGIIPGEEMVAWRTRAQTLMAEVKQAQIALEQAQLNLEDAHVRAPQAGVVQSRDVHTGQYVQAGAPLGTLLQREPLLLRFAVAEADAGRLKAGMQARFMVRGAEAEYASGIIHVSAAADATTRMVNVLARVNDSGYTVLRPGAFAEVSVKIGSDARAVVVPQTAVKSSERGFLAYVVEDDVAHERRVQLGMRTSDSRVEVRSGVAQGEALVVRGIEALTDGARVKVVATQTPGEMAGTESDFPRSADATGTP